jgi:hypothetical protein
VRARRGAAVAALVGVAGALGWIACARAPMSRAPQVESALFRGLWQPTYAPVAETRCWRGFQTAGGAPPPASVPFFISVGAAGEVTRVQPDLGALGAEVPAGFTECLAQIIRGMRFPAPGEPYMTRVLADRPPAASQPAP